jgi:hypothetical protein
MSTKFVMRLVHNDTSGARGESYVLVPKAARDAEPTFWDFPATHNDAMPWERDVVLDEEGVTHDRRVQWFEGRREFRLMTDLYHDAGASEGWYLEVFADPASGADYAVRFYDPQAAVANGLDSIATTPVQNSTKLWGYAP